MNRKISNQFFLNFLLMFVISLMVGIFTLMLLDFADHVISNSLVKNIFTAESLMQDDISKINSSKVIENAGGVQVIDKNYKVVLSEGINTIEKDKLTAAEFTKFLTNSKAKGILYNYSIEYNEKEDFWLIVTFPSSFRIDFAVVSNVEYKTVNFNKVIGVLVAIILFYFLLLALSTFIYSKLASLRIINPLKDLSFSVRSLRDGDYSARVNHNQNNELGNLADTFNEMAQKIEDEMFLRKKAEENRKKLILDISHDLKNPLASIRGYAELCIDQELSLKERADYAKIIYNNSIRANELITGLFEMSKMESSQFKADLTKVDLCEYVREEIGKYISIFDKEGFIYTFDIPKEELFVMLDIKLMDRVFSNLIYNAVKYNNKGTEIFITLKREENNVNLEFQDNGIGIPCESSKRIFEPFVRLDNARNSQTGGSGLGLAITKKIIKEHDGSIDLITDINKGCKFIITLPMI